VQSATRDVTHVFPAQGVDDSGVDDQDVGGGAVAVRALPAFAGAELEGREGGREGEGRTDGELFLLSRRRELMTQC